MVYESDRREGNRKFLSNTVLVMTTLSRNFDKEVLVIKYMGVLV